MKKWFFICIYENKAVPLQTFFLRAHASAHTLGVHIARIVNNIACIINDEYKI